MAEQKVMSEVRQFLEHQQLVNKCVSFEGHHYLITGLRLTGDKTVYTAREVDPLRVELLFDTVELPAERSKEMVAINIETILT